MAQLLVTYGSKTLKYTRMTVGRRLVYAGDARTLEGTETTFTISGLACKEDGTGATTFGQWLADLHRNMEKPRQSLTIASGNDILYKYDPADDDAWGPIPITFDINQFMGGKAALYVWRVKVFKKECFGTTFSDKMTGPQSQVLLSKAERHDYIVDQSGLTTRTIAGQITVRAQHAPADQWRNLCVPPAAGYFVRSQQHYAQSEDGLRLSYHVTDREVVNSLPAPVTDGEADYSVTMNEDSGLIVHYSLSGWFAAPVSVPKLDIAAQVVALLESRADLHAQGFRMLGMALKETIYNVNRVDFSFSWLRGQGEDTTPSALVQAKGIFQTPPNSSSDTSPVGPYGDSSNVWAWVLSAFDACDAGDISRDEGAGDYDNDVTQTQGADGGPQHASGAGSTTGISPDHQTSPYLAYHEKLSWEIDKALVAFFPKDVAVAPVVQQAHSPRYILVQAGYATRIGPDVNSAPQTPGPLLAADVAVVLSSSIQPETPEPVATTGNFKYTLHWRYVMLYIGAEVQIKLVYPGDPRLVDSGAKTIPPVTGATP